MSLAIHFPLLGCVRDFHPLDCAHAGRTCKKPLRLILRDGRAIFRGTTLVYSKWNTLCRISIHLPEPMNSGIHCRVIKNLRQRDEGMITTLLLQIQAVPISCPCNDGLSSCPTTLFRRKLQGQFDTVPPLFHTCQQLSERFAIFTIPYHSI